MTQLLTAARMRATEQAAIANGAVSGRALMERAGMGAIEAMLEWRPDLARTAYRAVVLSGPGNNGGDGFVVARGLRDRGWSVDVFLLGDRTALPPDAATNAQLWLERGAVHALDAGQVQDAAGPADLVVDALFGTGLTRPLEGAARTIAEGPMPCPVVALDIPSGLCADSGRALGACVDAALTVTFHRAKPGHYLAEGPARCGELRIVDIGL